MQKLFLLACIVVIGSTGFGDPSKPKTIAQKNSQCKVKSSGGEYPMFKVLKGKKVIYAPTSDGIVNALISPDGKYVALGAGETDLIEGFGVMIVNCTNEKRKGYLPGKATYLKEWNVKALITEKDELSFSGEHAQLLP